ncbi:hypothetical protein N1031_11090 [Herbiconiux moechotypicola]|uniref:Histidinol dehydrogenase n=1 Tax=Herbiconiux moechotypicola TaxID=637393 RepID=A0ABN3DN03_9MICO|nr:hypothetical protein [Herbiconiux moechotypicola]MCS5730307.1 hypothetical protein [Herbiconiux moechotypicola]
MSYPPAVASAPPAASGALVPSTGLRVLAVVVALALGFLFGVLGTIVHQITVSAFGLFDLPVGLIIALPAFALLLVGLRMVAPSRWAALAAAAGAVAIVALLALPGPGGSVLIPDSVLGMVWVVGAPLVAVVVLAWPRMRGASRPAA